MMDWQPAHAADEPIRAAFNAHQQSDKGLGAAAGPEAGPYLVARLREAGFDVAAASSPWQLGAADHALFAANAEGIVQAARETGDVPEAHLSDWLSLRRQGGSCTIGHLDILALPR
jgi:hypothetical protein